VTNNIDASNDDHPEFYRIEYIVRVKSGLICKNLRDVYDRIKEIKKDADVDINTIRVIKNQRVETPVTNAQIEKANKDRLTPSDRAEKAAETRRQRSQQG